MKELLDKFNYNLTRIKKLPDTRELIKTSNKKLEKEIEEFQEKVSLIQDSRVAYQKTVDAFYEESIGQLEKLINCALKTIFIDRDCRIKIELSGEDKKDKSFSFEVLETKQGQEVPSDLRDGSGAGIRAVISFVILSYYLTKFNSPYIFADECYSAISAEYMPAFFEFVRKLCKEQGLIFILITHDTKIIPHADQLIRVSQGRVTVETDAFEEVARQIEQEILEQEDKQKVD